MRAIVNINGFETPIDFEPEFAQNITASAEPAITSEGTDWKIEHSTYVELGGVVEISSSVVKTGIIEGTHVVNLSSYSKVLDFQATAMNVSAPPDTIVNEGCFITPVTEGFKIYAHALATTTQTIPVKWSAKVLK